MAVKKVKQYQFTSSATEANLGPAVSSTDCTGLIPAGLTEEEEIAAYEELYAFLPLRDTADVQQKF